MSSAVAQPLASSSRFRRGALASQGAVLVTGASSGIGAATVEQLALAGVHVLAGYRKEADGERLRSVGETVEPIRLDITDAADVDAATERVANLPHGLVALVNNAGASSVGPVEILALDRWRETVEVNLFGTIGLTHALLPGLLGRQGRIVNVSSPSGMVALPLFGPYSVSKFALEGFTDTLRREVGPHGVDVVCVQPGLASTALFDHGLQEADALLETVTTAQYDRYAKQIDSARNAARDVAEGNISTTPGADLIVRALTARRPRARYTQGREGRMATVASRVLSDRQLDLLMARLAG